MTCRDRLYIVIKIEWMLFRLHAIINVAGSLTFPQVGNINLQYAIALIKVTKSKGLIVSHICLNTYSGI